MLRTTRWMDVGLRPLALDEVAGYWAPSTDRVCMPVCCFPWLTNPGAGRQIVRLSFCRERLALRTRSASAPSGCLPEPAQTRESRTKDERLELLRCSSREIAGTCRYQSMPCSLYQSAVLFNPSGKSTLG